MSNYSQTTFFTPKDSLPTSNPAKTIFGAAYDVEFGNISTAITSKADTNGPNTFTALNNFTGGLQISGVAVSTISLSANNTWTGTNTFTSNVTIGAPSSGVALTVNSVAGQFGMVINGANTQFALQIKGTATAGQSEGLLIAAGTNSSDFALAVANAASSNMLIINGAGNVTIAAPSSGTALTVTGFGVTGTPAMLVAGANFAGSRGLTVQGGTVNSSDYAVIVADATNTNNLFLIQTNGTVTGRGPVAAAAVDMTPDKGSFTGTLTGCITSPTVTITWVRMGNVVILTIPLTGIGATSNTTACTITGLPAAIQPAANNYTCAAPYVENNNANATNGGILISAGSGAITLLVNGSNLGFTAAGTKGLSGGATITYGLT